MVCLLSNDGNQNKNTWHVAIEVYYLFILFIFQESKSKKVGLLIKALIKEFPLCSTSFYIYFCNYLDLYQLEFI